MESDLQGKSNKLPPWQPSWKAQLKRVNTGSAQLASHINTVAPSGGQNTM